MSAQRTNIRLRCGVYFAAAAVMLLALSPILSSQSALAQEPPLDYPGVGKLPGRPDAITLGDWALYPTFKVFSVYSDNWFLSPSSPISAFGVGISPAFSAEWTNGIHKTTIFASLEHKDFPAEPEINTLDYSAGIKQRYEMLRDLIFSGQFTVNHTTISPGLTSGAPNTASAPSSTQLANGNTLLPNGNIVSPTGQVVGSSNPALSVNGTSVVNPSDQFTGMVSVDKYFNRAEVSFSSTLTHTEYAMASQSLPNSTAIGFSGNGSFWLTPIFYAYSNGSWSDNSNAVQDTSSFRAVGGLGLRLNQFFGASSYFGRQGTDSSGQTGGDVYGVSLSYNPLPDLTFTASGNETINIAPSTGVQTPFVQSLGTQTPLLVPIGDSTKTTALSFGANYIISPQWSASTNFSYTHVEYTGSTRLETSWLADAALTYQMWRNFTLSLDYQYASIVSTVANENAKRNLVTMSGTYKF